VSAPPSPATLAPTADSSRAGQQSTPVSGGPHDVTPGTTDPTSTRGSLTLGGGGGGIGTLDDVVSGLPGSEGTLVGTDSVGSDGSCGSGCGGNGTSGVVDELGGAVVDGPPLDGVP
jgi:hypothetical protein